MLVALLLSALIAGDPDMEWSVDGSPASAPAPAMPPPLAPVSASPLIEEMTPDAPDPVQAPLDKDFRFGIEADFGASPSGMGMGMVGLSLELGWMPLRYLRLHANLGGAWIPEDRGGLTNSGSARLTAGFDGVLPFVSGELFGGLESGGAYTNAGGPSCFDCGFGNAFGEWNWRPTLRLRGGYDFTALRPVIVGFDVAYSLVSVGFSESHWAELHGRLGVAF